MTALAAVRASVVVLARVVAVLPGGRALSGEINPVLEGAHTPLIAAAGLFVCDLADEAGTVMRLLAKT